MSSLRQLPPLLPGHVLAVTGGLSGIGRAIAITFLSHGAKVAINYLPSDNADETHLLSSFRTEAISAIHSRRQHHPHLSSTTTTTDISSSEEESSLPLLLIPGDISHPQTAQSFIASTITAFSRLDTFISNAGICRFEEFLSVTPGLLTSHLDVNLSGAFYAVQAAARQMTTQADPPGGSIIGVSSISALVGGAQQCHYTPTKAGVLSLMQSCAAALGKYGIRCNALLPGTIRTRLNEEDLREGSDKKGYMEGRIPLGRLGVPDDMGGPAVFLACGELSGYVSGAAILVDGGAFVNFQ